jgi:hypothetical protein
MIRRRLHSRLTLLASLPVFIACAAGGVQYSGTTQRKVLDPGRLGSGDKGPPGLRRLGQLTAGCRLADVRDGLDGVALSDVGCSTELLSAALRERAADAGGTFLIDLRCDPDSRALAPGRRATCSADVWGPRDPSDEAMAAEPTTSDPGSLDPRGPAAPLAPAYGSVSEAWRVLVDYWPAPGQTARASVAPEQVAEIDFPRVGFVRLGDVRVRADETCSIDTLRGAVRAAAARIGATSVVDVRCVASDEARLCVASVAALEVDEPLAEVR